MYYYITYFKDIVFTNVQEVSPVIRIIFCSILFIVFSDNLTTLKGPEPDTRFVTLELCSNHTQEFCTIDSFSYFWTAITMFFPFLYLHCLRFQHTLPTIINNIAVSCFIRNPGSYLWILSRKLTVCNRWSPAVESSHNHSSILSSTMHLASWPMNN